MWTTERTELLTILWKSGSTASQIAATLGQPFTRNAVMGKVARLRISHDPTGPAPERRPPRKRVAKKIAAPAPPEPDINELLAPPRDGVSFDDMDFGRQCAWVASDHGEPARYCGAPFEKRPFCARHAARVYVKGSAPKTFIPRSALR